MEIERKFLVKEKPNNILTNSKITQGYLCFDPEIRIRSIDDEKFFLTIKTNECSVIRDEYEIEIPKTIYFNLFNMIKSIISKTRSYIDLENGLVAEMDSYDSGLVIVEVEFKTIEDAEKFILPNWFGKDITRDKIYKNINLAQKILQI